MNPVGNGACSRTSASSLLSTEFFTSSRCFTLELVGRLNVGFKEVGSDDSLNGQRVLPSVGFDVI